MWSVTRDDAAAPDDETTAFTTPPPTRSLHAFRRLSAGWNRHNAPSWLFRRLEQRMAAGTVPPAHIGQTQCVGSRVDDLRLEGFTAWATELICRHKGRKAVAYNDFVEPFPISRTSRPRSWCRLDPSPSGRRRLVAVPCTRKGSRDAEPRLRPRQHDARRPRRMARRCSPWNRSRRDSPRPCRPQYRMSHILFVCPNGRRCGLLLGPQHVTRPQPDARCIWKWDGSRECPTITPSINCLAEKDGKPAGGCGWHGFITNGKIA